MYAGLDSVTIWSQDLRVRIPNWGVQERRGQKYDCGVDKIDANDGEPASANN